jgi:hypothetical protein
MCLIGLNFFNEGAEFMMTLACIIQYFEWEVEPSRVSLYLACICLPQAFSFLFALVADTTSVLGQQKKFYVVVPAMLQTVMGFHLATTDFEEDSSINKERKFAIWVSMIMLARSILTPVIQGLMII